jgi:hypothetical protein
MMTIGGTRATHDAVSRSRPATFVVSAVVLAVKAGLGLWAAYALMTASRTHHRSFIGSAVTARHTGLGLLLLLLAAVSLVAVGALLSGRRWARASVFGIEGIGAALAISRIASRPASSLVSLGLSAVIVGLLLSRPAASPMSRR